MNNKVLRGLVAGVCAGMSGAVFAADTASVTQLEEMTVTGTREGQLKSETPATVDVIKGEAIKDVRPTHPSQIMGQVPGVWINTTSGEGHQTAIRQPLTTSAVYLYLEDGIPVRSTGFFNHNALYEVNIPQAGGIEINKGPGSALYGSDAIGGVVNVLTRPTPLKPEADVSVDVGEFGWKRMLVSGGNTQGDNGWRADVNLTQTDGWRTKTAYERQSGTLRWDRALGSDATLKMVAAYTNVDQDLAGSSTLTKDDYENNPTANYTQMALRKVKAFRISAAYERESANSLLSITPYVRDNEMDLIANWALGYDPTIANSFNRSFGVTAKYRQDFVPYRARLVVGVDVDNSPGGRKEKSIATTKVGSVYTAYTEGATVYDYDVTYRGISPYIHGEMSPNDRLRLIAGLRYDDMRYDYDNKMADGATSVVITGPSTKWYGHVGDTSRSYRRFSPKLGATYVFSQELNGFANYSQAFRAPSESQLFRPSNESTALRAQANAQAALDLKPVKVENYEIGLRGKAAKKLNWEASLYHMIKRDDILSVKDVSGATMQANSGKTLHRGIEVGLGAELAQELRLDVAYSYAKHTYEEWISKNSVGVNVDYSGKEMSAAPRTIANTRLSYAPGTLNGGKVALEWVRLGSYWVNDDHDAKYEGHDVFNLRANYLLDKQWEVFGSIMNLTDKRYAESTKFSNGSVEYAPAMPRTVYAGLRYNWGK
ncbi:MAG: TonB-dependent receptor [Gammaproteobacteria bacterium]|nr:TonB-dependent receptor [Gammaproteobacteria bacterium]MBU1980138.1 TonB-dependent receptor [Gammaproteobacteria bacterium]